jgi:hypothetical protein
MSIRTERGRYPLMIGAPGQTRQIAEVLVHPDGLELVLEPDVPERIEVDGDRVVVKAREGVNLATAVLPASMARS